MFYTSMGRRFSPILTDEKGHMTCKRWSHYKIYVTEVYRNGRTIVAYIPSRCSLVRNGVMRSGWYEVSPGKFGEYASFSYTYCGMGEENFPTSPESTDDERDV